MIAEQRPSLDVASLDNGLRLVCDCRPNVQSVAFGIWVQAGTLDETVDEHGVAHLLEHMAFKATTNRNARDIAIEIEQVGASLDAATSHQRTGYYVRCLRDDIQATCEVLADILVNPIFNQVDLELEQEVVVQEIGEAADEPDDLLFEKLADIAWGGQGLGRPILGTPDSVRAQSPSSLRTFMSDMYRGPTMVFSAAGAITIEELETLARTYFAGVTSQDCERNRPLPLWRGGFSAITKPTEQCHVALGFHGLGYDSPDFMAARLFADVLGGGMSSRLFQKVREQAGLAYSVYGYADIFDHGGLVGAYLGTDMSKAEQALKLTLQEISDMAQSVRGAELDRAKALARANILMGREAVAARAEMAAAQMITFGRLRSPEEIIEQVMDVTTSQVEAIAQSVVQSSKPALSVVGPLDAEPLWAMLSQ